MEGDRNLEAVFIIGKPSRLPEGYTEVEYIQNANTSSYFSVSKAFYDDSTNGAAFEIVFALPTL